MINFSCRRVPFAQSGLHPFVHWRWTKGIPCFITVRTYHTHLMVNSFTVCLRARRCLNMMSWECYICGSCFERWWLSSHHFSAVALFVACMRLPAANFRDCQNCLSHGKIKVLPSRNIWISLFIWSCSYCNRSCSVRLEATVYCFCAVALVCGSHVHVYK